MAEEDVEMKDEEMGDIPDYLGNEETKKNIIGVINKIKSSENDEEKGKLLLDFLNLLSTSINETKKKFSTKIMY